MRIVKALFVIVLIALLFSACSFSKFDGSRTGNESHIEETGIYKVSVTGKNAKGSVSIIRVKNDRQDESELLTIN